MASLGYSPIVHPHEVASNDVYQAWGEYTGFPGLITGGLGALGFNVVSQAGQVKSGTSIFAASRYGFALALLLEASVGAMILATALTFIDPGHKIEGGLDESRFYLEHLEKPALEFKGKMLADYQPYMDPSTPLIQKQWF